MITRKELTTVLCLIWIVGQVGCRRRKAVLIDLVNKPCSEDDIEATDKLPDSVRDARFACDGDTETFYHSMYTEGVRKSPHFNLTLDNTYLIKSITVVNVYTGAHCTNNAVNCTERLSGARVEVIKNLTETTLCGTINVRNNNLTVENQTYSFNCGEDGAEGNHVRVRLENSYNPLMIAEISAQGYKPTKLKTQPAFEPTLESGVKQLDLSNGDNELDDPVPSPAICQLDEVDVIKTSAADKIEYHLTLKTSAGDMLCDVKIVNGAVTLDNGNVPLPEDDTQCSDNPHYKVSYKEKVLKISAQISDDKTFTCQLKEHDTNDNADPEESEIDTRYLSKKSFGLSLVGTNVAVYIKDSKYEVMENKFKCGIQGSMFNAARIECGSGEPSNADGLQKTCSDILDGGKASCTFTIPADENGVQLLEDVTFKIERGNISYYNCEAGYELDKTEGQCNACDRGKYKKTGSSCVPCSGPPEYAPNVGSSKCETCEGSVNAEFTTCTRCLPEQVVKDNKCEQCSAGQFPNNNECEPCKEFTFSSPGFTTCRSCQVGYEVNDQKTGCDPCPPGEYNDAPTTSKCKPCANGKTTTSYGQGSCTEDLDKYCVAIDYDGAAATIGKCTFPHTKAGQTSRSPCTYNTASDATRLCNNDGKWDEPDLSKCNSKKTKDFEEIENTYTELDAVVQKTKTDVAPKDVEILVTKMSNKDKMVDQFESQTGTSIEGLTAKTLDVMSNLMVAAKTSPTEQAVKNSVVHTAETILSMALSHLRDGDTTIDLQTAMMDVFLLKDASSAPEMNVGDSRIRVDVSKDSNIGKLAVSVYKNNSMFRVPGGGSEISGKVVGLKNLLKDETQDKINFKINFSKEGDSSKRVVRQCMYYKTTTDSWSTEGCKTTFDENNNVVCECDHMTSFAIIMSVEADMTVGWLSDLVLGLNIFFCCLTLLCTLPFRTFRVRKMTIIQSHSILCLILLCTCWYLMHLDFGNPAPAYESTKCKVIAFTAHYFLMATFSWICCCTLTLKSQIVDAVKSFGKKNKNLVKKCVLFAYGFPLLIPTLALILNYLLQAAYKGSEGAEVHYIRATECWYDDVWMYCLILFPIYVFMLINFVCFFKIMIVVGNARRASDGSSERRVVKAGFALAFTQGLPWIIHPGVIAGSAAAVFQYLFLITFGLQGIGLFMFNVLFQEEVLKNLCGMLNVKPPDIFLSVVPKQRQSPHTGETSMATSRNCSSQENKSYSNNITLNSVTAVGEKSIYQDSTYYNELHESSLVTEHRCEAQLTLARDCNANMRSEGSRTELFDTKAAPDSRVRFVGNNRVYTAAESNSDVQRSPIPGETLTETAEHQGPPLM